MGARANSQSSCPNSDFESGTLDGWSGRTGNCCPIFTYTTGPLPSGIVYGRHTLMTGTGTDPNTCNNVTVVAPGGLYSARVGNDQGGSEAETLSYSITVTPTSPLFIYKYAVVLQDPGHIEEEQPRFQVKVLDENGLLIDPVCGEYTVVAGAGMVGFETCISALNGDIRYRDWTTVGLNLTDYIGQTLTIEFETGDCTPGGHFGYAYVDAYCSQLVIDAAFCTSSSAAELTAPIGFEYLWSTGEDTQTIVINNPTANANYSCTLTSVTGCSVVISTTLQLEDPNADFIITNTCFDNAVFEDTTVLVNPSLLDNYLWDFGDGTTSTEQNPVHSFPAPGTYTVQFTAFNTLGCSTSITKSITVYLEPTAQINYDRDYYCTSETAVKAVTLIGTGNYTGGTFTANVPGLSLNALTGEFNPSTSTPGSYVVSYNIPVPSGCTPAAVETDVAVYLTPQAFLNYSASSYCSYINTVQNPNLTGIGITGGNYTATPSGLSINTATGQINPSLSQGGVYTITYNVPQNGVLCNSINGTATVTIITASTAVLQYASPFCTSQTSPQVATLTGTGVIGPGTFSSFPTGLSLNTVTGAITPSLSTPGNYTVEYFVPGGGGCPGFMVSANVVITVLPTAAISYGGPFCRSVTTPQAVALTGTAAFTGGVYTAPLGIAVNSSTGEITPSGSIAGTHQIVYSIPATLGCTPNPVTTNVTILPLPEPLLTNFAICKDPSGTIFRPALLDTGLSDLFYSCQWFFNGAPIPGVTINRYTANVEGNYSVLVTNLATGCVSPAVVSIVSNAVIVEDFQTYVTNTFSDNNTLTVLVSGGTGPYLFSIDSLPFQTSNVFTQLTPGVHTVSITDVNNCTDVTKRVTVLGFPNYFTPNGDGKNDFWNIHYFDAQPNAKIYIYDRFGKLITQLSPQSPGWDGSYNGKLMPSTDYWFMVEFLDYDENGEMVWQTFKSHFSMLR